MFLILKNTSLLENFPQNICYPSQPSNNPPLALLGILNNCSTAQKQIMNIEWDRLENSNSWIQSHAKLSCKYLLYFACVIQLTEKFLQKTKQIILLNELWKYENGCKCYKLVFIAHSLKVLGLLGFLFWLNSAEFWWICCVDGFSWT